MRAGALEGLVPASYVENLPMSPVRPASTYSNSTASLAESIAGTMKKKGWCTSAARAAGAYVAATAS